MKLSNIFLLFLSLFLTHACQSMQQSKYKIYYKDDVYHCFENLTKENTDLQKFLKKNTTTRGAQWTPLHLAARYPNALPLKYFLAQQLTHEQLNSQDNILKQTPLHVAVSAVKKNRHCINHVKLLIKAGAQLNLKDINDNTPLDLAKNNEDLELLNVLVQCNRTWSQEKLPIKKLETKKIEEEEEQLGFFDYLLNFAALDLNLINHSPEIQKKSNF